MTKDQNKAYLLHVDGRNIPVYCHMTNEGLGACGGGGWTLVMKMNGANGAFHYDSVMWSNKLDHNLAGGKTGLDAQETKLPTYWEHILLQDLSRHEDRPEDQLSYHR